MMNMQKYRLGRQLRRQCTAEQANESSSGESIRNFLFRKILEFPHKFYEEIN